LILGLVGKIGLFEEGIAGGYIFLEAHIDGANEFLDVQVSELGELIAGLDVVAEGECVIGGDVVLLSVFVAAVEEGDEVVGGGDAQVEELDDLQVAQVIVLLDGLAEGLGYDAHLDVVLDQLQEGLVEVVL
jgi:hypothetical protein